MALSRFATLYVLFGAMLAISAPASHAQVNFIGFCADDRSMGMFIGDGKSALTCSSETAVSDAKRIAISFADRFARQGCVRFSQNRCDAICSQAGTVPLRGPAAHGATFSQDRQRQQLFPADSVQWVNRGGGFCTRTQIMQADSGTPSGASVCPVWHYPFHTQKTAGTARAFSFCGCACR